MLILQAQRKTVGAGHTRDYAVVASWLYRANRRHGRLLQFGGMLPILESAFNHPAGALILILQAQRKPVGAGHTRDDAAVASWLYLPNRRHIRPLPFGGMLPSL